MIGKLQFKFSRTSLIFQMLFAANEFQIWSPSHALGHTLQQQ